MKSDKTSFMIYADLESLIKKIDNCKNNPENSLITKIGQHIPCRYSMPPIWAFDNIEKKHSLCREEGCMKMFCSSLREQAANVITFERKKLLTLIEKELKLHQDSTVKKTRKNPYKSLIKIKSIVKLKTIVI